MLLWQFSFCIIMKQLEGYIICSLIIIVVLLAISYRNIVVDYRTAINNNKAYEHLLDSTKNNELQFKYTIKELENSKDSVLIEMNKVSEQLKIKNKNLKQIEYINTVTKINDSIFIKDTIFKHDFRLDTSIFDDWHKINLYLEYPSNIKIKSSFKNETYITTSYKKETIKPASKIFFVRWFQKKTKVVEVNVIQKNPYTENVEQRFIEIVK